MINDDLFADFFNDPFCERYWKEEKLKKKNKNDCFKMSYKHFFVIQSLQRQYEF